MQKFSWVAISGFMRQFAFFVVNGYLALLLSKETFGTLTYAYGALLVFVGIADFGLREVAWRDVARNSFRTSQVVNHVLAARLLMTLLAMVGYFATAILYCHTKQDWVIFAAYSLGLFFNMTSFDFPFLGHDRVDTLSKSSAIAYAYYVPACFITVRSDATAWLVPAHFVVAHAIFFALLYREYCRTVGPVKLCFRVEMLAANLRRSWPLGLNGLIFRLTINYPVLLLGLLLNSIAVAEYRVAELFYSLFVSLGLYLGSSSFTTYASYDGDGDIRIARSVEKSLCALILAHLPIAYLFATLLPWTLAHWLGGSSAMTGTTCLLLGLSLPVAVATRYLKTCLPSVGLNAQLLVVNVVSLVLGVAIGVMLMQQYSGAGIAASLIVSESFGIGLLIFFLKQKLPQLRATAIFRAPLAVVTAGGFAQFAVVQATDATWLQITVPLTVGTTLGGWRAARLLHSESPANEHEPVSFPSTTASVSSPHRKSA
jgi:O-antigen/teichoic acid export membrane protein